MLRAPFALIWNLLKLLSYGIKRFFFWIGHVLTRKQRKWVRLKLPHRLKFGPAAGLAAYFQDKPSYIELREGIEQLADDPRIEGVVVTADRLQHGPARTADLRRFIDTLRDAGKDVVFHSHSIHGGDYDLATAADDVLMTPGGRFYMFGHRFEQFFAAPLLERLGVAAQFVHIGPFKTASHRFTKDEATPAQKLMMEQMVDSLSDLREGRIGDDRQLSDDELARCFERMPLDDRQAEALGLVDGCVHRRFVARWIAEGDDFIDTPGFEMPPEAMDSTPEPAGDEPSAPGGPDAPPPLEDDAELDADDANVHIKDAANYIDATPTYEWTPLIRKPRKVATVDLSGMIVMPGMELPGHSVTTIDPDEVLPVLRKLGADSSVGAVVLHINSPGGSALASELLWDGIRRLRYEKPTLAYCSDVAASGGYYMAAGADRIICQPETITGSIGVIAGKFSFPGTLDHIDVGSESFKRHDTSAFESLTEPLSEEVLDNLQRDARSFYRKFLRRVGDARQLPRRRLHRYARGRIYTGDDAHNRFLVDHLGGFDDAVDLARELAEPTIKPSTPVQFQPHRTVSFPALLRQSAVAPSMTSSIVEDAIGDTKFLHELVSRDPLLALMPYELESTRH